MAACPEAILEFLPAAAIGNLESAFRHTRAALPDVAMLPPLVRARRGVRGSLEVVRGLALARCLVAPKVAAPPTLRRVLSAQAVVTRGDALLVDRPSARGLLSIWAANFPAVVAARGGVPTILSGAEIGPFEHAAPRALASAILRRYGLVIARNTASESAALELGVPARRLREAPDPAFTFPAPTFDAVARMRTTHARSAARLGVVVVGVDSPLPGMSRALTVLSQTLKRLVEGGRIDRVLVVLQVDGRHISDRRASLLFVEQAADPRIALLDEDLSPAELTALFGAASFTLGTRMHMGILSLVAGTPTFVVALWPKVQKLLGALGINGLVVSYPDLGIDDLYARIDRAIEQSEVARARAREVATREGERFTQTFNRALLDCLHEPS